MVVVARLRGSCSPKSSSSARSCAMDGLLLAQWFVDALLLLAPAPLPRREAIAVNGTVAAFAIVVALPSALIISLMPASQAATSNVVPRLKQDPMLSRRRHDAWSARRGAIGVYGVVA